MYQATRFEIKKSDVSLPQPAYATLLSEAELNTYAEYIKSVEAPVYDDNETLLPPAYWYLRDFEPNDEEEKEEMVGIACGNVVDSPSDPDYFDIAPDGAMGTGNRPAVIFEEDLPCNPGDELEFNYYHFTVLSKRMILLDEYISTGIFDKETNVYEDSAIKARVDEWFKHNFGGSESPFNL